ncbi:MAG TPA: FtsQ-type POTRA domain-containing protein [Acidimicrobiales bacterium]|nr:FtsQ-type POTRA domain-containing protein [Acidimicrobiales bacterium]
MPIRIGTPVPPPKPSSEPSPKPSPKPSPRDQQPPAPTAKQAPGQPAPARPKQQPPPTRPAARTRPDPSPQQPAAAPERPRTRIDPRFHRRWAQVRRAEGRRRLRVLLIALGVLGLALGGVALTRSPLLNVDHVVVEGATHTGADKVVAAAHLGGHPAMLDVSAGAVARRVAALPWVARATARRDWPATVRITVEERRAVAAMPGPNNQWALVDLSGHVLEVVPARPADAPGIEGLDPVGEPGSMVGPAGQVALQVAGDLPADLRARTAAVVVAAPDSGDTELKLVPTGLVRLGDASQLAEKLQAALTVLLNVDPKVVKVLDVRVARAPVLTRR